MDAGKGHTDLHGAYPAAPVADPLVAAAACFRANEVAPHPADAMLAGAKNPRIPAVAAKTRTASKGGIAVELQSFMALMEDVERQRE